MMCNNLHNLGLDGLLGLIISILTTTICMNCQNVNNPELTHNNSLVIEPPVPFKTSPIHVGLHVNPYVEHLGTIYVASNVDLNITSKLTDEKYKNASVNYEWSTKDQIIASGVNKSSIIYKFPKTFDSNFIKVNVTHENEKHENETGFKQLDVIVKAPVIVSDPIGKLFLEHGELLNIVLVINGSAPFTYCYRVCQEESIIPCQFCLTYETTNDTKIPVKKYLHYVGNYTLFFDVSNIMNRETRHYAIKINETVRERSLPIAPIASSILAVLILLTGITLHLKFRKTAYTETADFDFIGPGQEEDEWEDELSFIQRVKYIFCGSDLEDFSERRHIISRNVDQN